MPSGKSLPIPTPSLVVMVGPSGSGKSTFCQRNFRSTQVISSDSCRAWLTDDPGNQSASGAAFRLGHTVVTERLRRGRLTVFDATNVARHGRRELLELAESQHLPAVAIVLDLPLDECVRQNRLRSDRRVSRPVIDRQAQELRASMRGLSSEGFAAVHRIRSARVAASTQIVLKPLACDRSHDSGPFDIIGDVHGCAGELTTLLARLGYRRESARDAYSHPEGRRVIFIGDLVDRGPRILETAWIGMRMVEAGTALCVPGNHDVDLLGHLDGGRPELSPGTLRSLRQIESIAPHPRRIFIDQFRRFVEALPSHLVLDTGRLAVAHAGLKSRFVGRDSEEVRRFALQGETTDQVDRYGLPVRVNWAAAYRGRATIVYGHTAVPEPEWLNNTVNIDTGCVYGGQLTALRYPEMRTVSVPARRAYYRPRRFLPRGVGFRADARSVPVR